MKNFLIPVCLAMTLACFPLLAHAMPLEGRDTVSSTMTNQNDDQMLRETFHVAGDAPDPAGGDLRGMAPGYRFTQSAMGHPICFYAFGPKGEMPMTVDIYQLPDQPMYAHLLCPHCFVRSRATNGIIVRADIKEMSYDPAGFAPTFPGWTDREMAMNFPRGTGGLLSIARFRCTWEADGTKQVNQGIELGSNLCDFEVVIDRNVVRRFTSSNRPT